MKLHTKSDFTALMHRFLDPLLPLYSEGGARLHLGDTGVTYPGRTIEMEAFSRPLWALAPFWTGGGRADDFLRIYRKGLASGTDPESPEYWGDPNDYDQLFVEMAALACAILETPESVWEPLTDAEKALVTNYDVLVEAEAEYARLAAEQGKKLDNIYTTTGDYISGLGTPDVGSIGGEWMVIDLARSGRTVPDGYYEKVVEYVQKHADENERLHRAKATDNSRIILALTAIGKDVTNVGGHNLLKGLDSMDYIQTQGINGPIWALIALDSHNYPTSGDVTREKLIQAILDAQLPGGGWNLSGNDADPDMTAMAIQALAPYYKENDAVKAAVDKALDVLSELQLATGGFGSWGTENSESCAQVIVALTALGIDPAKCTGNIERTGNPSAPEIQNLLSGDRRLYLAAADQMVRHGAALMAETDYVLDVKELRSRAPKAFLLLLGCAGLLLCGGGDLDPVLYGQPDQGSQPPDPARDQAELELFRAFYQAGRPILGVCRGMQIINVALGGTLLQDLGDVRRPSHTHPQADQVHPVRAQPGSLLHTLYGPRFSVNSSHHQAVDCPAPGLVLTLRAVDGVPEAIEHPSLPILGVQFHPERMSGPLLRPDTVDGAPIFRWFLALCGRTGPVSSSTQEVSQL